MTFILRVLAEIYVTSGISERHIHLALGQQHGEQQQPTQPAEPTMATTAEQVAQVQSTPLQQSTVLLDSVRERRLELDDTANHYTDEKITSMLFWDVLTALLDTGIHGFAAKVGSLGAKLDCSTNSFLKLSFLCLHSS